MARALSCCSLGLGLAVFAAGLAASCGSDGAAEPGFSSGNDASVDVFLGSDAPIWPDADPSPDAGPGPSPGFDGGTPASSP